MAIDTSKDDTPLTTDFRARLKRALHGALKTRNNTLIVAPTSLGKTHEVATTRWQDYPEFIGTAEESSGPVIHISQSKKARDQAQEMSEAAGVRSHVLKGREDVCDVANGDFDDTLSVPRSRLSPSEWFNLKCDVQGIGFGKAHAQLSRLLNGLPCSNSGPCEGLSQWWKISDDGASEIDIVHTTANFAYNPDLIENRVVV